MSKLTVEQIESLVGMGAGAWDTIDPQMLIDTISAAAIRELVPYMKTRAAQLVDQMPLTTQEVQNDGAWRRDVRQLLKMMSFLPSDHETQAPADDAPDVPMTSDFVRDLTRVINSHSKENGSNTPDFILARLLAQNLAAFDEAANARRRWARQPLKADDIIVDEIKDISGPYVIPKLKDNPSFVEFLLRVYKKGFQAALPVVDRTELTGAEINMPMRAVTQAEIFDVSIVKSGGEPIQGG